MFSNDGQLSDASIAGEEHNGAAQEETPANEGAEDGDPVAKRMNKPVEWDKLTLANTNNVLRDD